MKNLVLAIVLALPFTAFAQTKADRAACEARDPSVDRAACLKEMVNARADKSLTTPSADELRANALKRCDMPGVDKIRCVARVSEGKKTGSAEKGGTITELREVVPAK
jgi:hypothetical protein